MPSSSHTGRITASKSRVHSEYSDCSAAMGCTWGAPRMVFVEGHRRIDAMLVVKINMVDAETFETGIARCTHIRRCSIDAEGRAVGSAHDAELGGQHDLVAPRFQHLSEQAFV